MHAFNPSTQKAEGQVMSVTEFKASLLYIVNWRPARVKKWVKPCLKKEKRKRTFPLISNPAGGSPFWWLRIKDRRWALRGHVGRLVEWLLGATRGQHLNRKTALRNDVETCTAPTAMLRNCLCEHLRTGYHEAFICSKFVWVLPSEFVPLCFTSIS